jgi:heat shock protein HslJ/uncharacterized lipoprotein NlpE involved in copper resistance
MNNFNLLIIAAVTYLFTANCAGRSVDKEQSSKMVTTDTSIAATGHTSANSLDWNGTYRGILTCPDCEGIQTTLTLNKDNTYLLESIYLGKSNNVEKEAGNFSWNAEGNSITLYGVRKQPNRYFVAENKIIQLDTSGNRLAHSAIHGRELIKTIDKPIKQDSVPDAELVETYWKLTELMGKPVAKTPQDQKEPHIILKRQDNRVQGFAGCNSLGGFYELKGNSLKFREITTTLMACADMEVETKFKEVLEIVDNYSIRQNSLSLNKAKMAPLARFEAVYLK